jgi:hypothetical protein
MILAGMGVPWDLFWVETMKRGTSRESKQTDQ